MSQRVGNAVPFVLACRELGLPAVERFEEVTGESTATRPADVSMDDPRILEFTQLVDAEGTTLTPGTPEADDSAVSGTRRTSTAATSAAASNSGSSLTSRDGSSTSGVAR